MSFPGADVKVSSWQQMMVELHSRRSCVFRGMDDSSWPLETSLKRLLAGSTKNIDQIERSLICNFRKYANAGAFDDKSEWYVLAVAQHNGLPTRCLDWTASPLIAAHFACGNEAYKARDGAIWCLRADAIAEILRTKEPNRTVYRELFWVFDTKQMEQGFQDLSALNRGLDPNNKLMLLWEPPSLDARIANQSGLLSLMNGPEESQNEFLDHYSKDYPDLIFRINIDASAKPEIRDMLDQNNISERTLFPSLPGLCSWLKRYHGKAW